MRHTNLDYLKEIANGSNAFMAEMIDLFIEQTPAVISSLEEACRMKDWKKIRGVAHKMKPSVSFMGLKEIEQDVRMLEEYADKECNIEQIPALISHVKKVCIEGMEELKEELERLS